MGPVGRIQTWDFILVPLESFETRRILFFIFIFFEEHSWRLWGKQSLGGQEWKLRHQLGSKCNNPYETSVLTMMIERSGPIVDKFQMWKQQDLLLN